MESTVITGTDNFILFAILHRMVMREVRPYISPEKPGNFDMNFSILQRARITDNKGYGYIAAGLVSQLLNRSGYDPRNAVKMKITRRPEVDIYVRFAMQVQAADITNSLKDQITDTLHYPLQRGFLPDFIDNADQIAHHTPSRIQVEEEAAYYPHIFSLWQNLQEEFPVLKTMALQVADPAASPFEQDWFHADERGMHIEVPFNWKLTMQLLRNLYPTQVEHIADNLEIDKRLVTDDILLSYHFLHAVGHAVLSTASEQPREKDVSSFALKRIIDQKDTHFVKTIAMEQEAIDLHEFQQLLQELIPEEQEQSDILLAYNIAIIAHKDQKRASNEPYFSSHLLQTAIILLKAGIRNPLLIAGALLHDVMEDTIYFAKNIEIDPENPTKAMYERMAKIFSPELAQIIEEVTERELIYNIIQNVSLERTKKDIEEDYHERFATRSVKPETILLKLPDRLHNMRTLKFMQREKQIAKIRETKEIYLPVFRLPLSDLTNDPIPPSYEKARIKLLRQLEKEIEQRERELGIFIEVAPQGGNRLW